MTPAQKSTEYLSTYADKKILSVLTYVELSSPLKMNGEQQWEKSVRVPQNLLLTGGKETAVTKHSNAPRYQRAPRAQCGTQATRGSWELGYGRTARRSSAQHLQLGEDL